MRDRCHDSGDLPCEFEQPGLAGPGERGFSGRRLGQRSIGNRLRPQPVVLVLGNGNRILVAEVVEVDSIGLTCSPGRNCRDAGDAEGPTTDLERNAGRPGRRDCDK